MDSRGDGDLGQQLGSLASGFVTYLRTRTAEQWLFFAVGLIVGILIA